jgi:hypothetical protein
LIDIDSTLLVRCEKDDLFSAEGEDNFCNDSFECRRVKFKFQSRDCVVLFRYGVGAFLRHLSQHGQVCLVTHACEVYAQTMAKFLEKQTGCNSLLVRCVRRGEVKLPPLLSGTPTPSTPLLIVDDKPDRWGIKYRDMVTEIPSLTECNVGDDVELRRLYTLLLDEAELSSSYVKFDLRSKQQQKTVNYENPLTVSTLTKCSHRTCGYWMTRRFEDKHVDFVEDARCPRCDHHCYSSSDEEVEEDVKAK